MLETLTTLKTTEGSGSVRNTVEGSKGLCKVQKALGDVKYVEDTEDAEDTECVADTEDVEDYMWLRKATEGSGRPQEGTDAAQGG